MSIEQNSHPNTNVSEELNQHEAETAQSIVIDAADEVKKRMNLWLGALPLFLDNGYTVRAMCYGVASACGRQIDYIENRLQTANAGRLRSLINTATAMQNGAQADVDGTGESDSQETIHSIHDQISEVQARIMQNEESLGELRMLQRCAINAHDSYSIPLNLPVWTTIQAGSVNKAASASKLIDPKTAEVLERLDRKRETAAAARRSA